MGVRNVDQILNAEVSDEVRPKDPAQENMDALENVPLEAFKGQDHMAHIQAHLLFVTGGVAATLPQVVLTIQKHILNHIQLMAEEQAEAAFAQQNPNVAIADPANNAPFQAMVAQFVAQGMQQVVALGQQIQQAGQPQEQQGPDPLIALKEQELQLKAQQEQNDVAEEQAKLQLEREKLAQREANFQQRLASQESQTQARIQAGIERELLKQRGDA